MKTPRASTKTRIGSVRAAGVPQMKLKPQGFSNGGGVKMRGTGAATKGCKSRGPMG